MPRTLFRPQIDGLPHYPHDPNGEASEGEVREAFSAAAATVTGDLEGIYDGAVAGYRIEEKLTSAIEADLHRDFIWQHGLLIGILDYFHARRFRPQFSAADADESGDLFAFLKRRAVENLAANAGKMLTWLASGYLLPEDWLSADRLEESVRRELQRRGISKNASVELKLRIPYGGERWLADQTFREYNKLKTHLDSGRPWPVRLIECGRSLFQNRTVVVYGYDEHSSQDVTFFVYDINGLPVEKKLRLRWDNGFLTVIDSQLFPLNDPIQGIFCEEYAPERPPDGLGRGWLGPLWRFKPAWYFIRYGRLFFLWLKNRAFLLFRF
jgi:hypothetical protein